jgi:hypothetical protein
MRPLHNTTASTLLRTKAPSGRAALTIRPATADDEAAIARLAVLDTSPVPTGPLLVAQVGDDLWAAAPLGGGDGIADPFRPSADALLLLHERSRQIRRAAEPRRGLKARVAALRPLAHS